MLPALVAAACAGFLLAVLWMDLIFDVQVLRHRDGELPESVLASIALYYRRATTTSKPMGHLIALVMLTLLGTVIAQAIHSAALKSWVLVAICAAPVLLALIRIVPDAIRLGKRVDDTATQSVLARRICRDHLLCFGALLIFLALHLSRALA